MKKFKHICNGIIWTLIVLYLLLIVLMHLPSVQTFLGKEVAEALADKFGTKVEVGKVNLGFFNRIIIDDVMMYDQQGDSLIYASRLSAKIDYMAATQGKISVSSAQIFGLRANLYRQTAKSPANFQFVLDSLASKDTTQHKPLDLHIGSLIIRRGAIAYNQRDVAPRSGIFSPQHIRVSELSSHILLNHVTDNSIDLLLKKLSFKDESGFKLQSLHFKLQADRQKATLKEFRLLMPRSELVLDDLKATYRFEGKRFIPESLHFEGGIQQSKITFADVASLVPALRHFDDAVFVSSRFSGTAKSISVPSLNLRTGSGSINLQARGSYSHASSHPVWNADIANLNLSPAGVEFLAENLGSKVKIPKEIQRLGTIHLTGKAKGYEKVLSAKGNIETDAGNISLQAVKNDDRIKASVDTRGVNLGRILDNRKLGTVVAKIDAHGSMKHIFAKGNIARFDYGNYDFHNIEIDGDYDMKALRGTASIADPNVNLSVKGDYHLGSRLYALDAAINHLRPTVLGMKMHDPSYSLDNISISANNKGKEGHLDVEAPFVSLYARGQYDLTTIYGSIMRLVADKLPTIPGISKHAAKGYNDFTLQANITSAEVLQRMFGLPLSLTLPVHINGNISDAEKNVNLYINAPNFSWDGSAFHDANIELNTIGDSLRMEARISQGFPYEKAPVYRLRAAAADNNLSTLLYYANQSSKLPITGKIDARTQFFTSDNGATGVHVTVNPSEIMLGEKKWLLNPADIIYRKNELTVDMLNFSHGDQHIIINGKATPQATDSIVADLKDVDVAYILNLVNFHSVDFAGKASGKAVVKSIFQTPEAYANLDVKDFVFENGPLGTLHAKAAYDNQEGQINIDATAEDGPEHLTVINGYVSPKRNYIDLGIEAHNTSLKFMENFCGSFLNNVEAWCKGKLNVVGDLKNINLVGDVVAHGRMHMKQLGTDYTFNHLRAHAIPDDIQFEGDSIYDSHYNGKHSHFALIRGGIHHKHLTRLSYDLDIDANNFLGFDTHEFGDDTFYGTVFATGTVGIHGKSGETIIDIDATPEPHSIFVYNVASPDAISAGSFIHWNDATPYIYRPYSPDNDKNKKKDSSSDFSSDMRINFLVNTNPNLTLKLMMDDQTGDYITLNGNGVIRANYYNKGGLDMFGNYVVDHGQYKLTIQNIIKKDFDFQPGGTIAFGGNPYNAPLNLQAKYTVNGVPLSDLNIGRSFSSNNIRVDCLMDITGTPGAPKVDFSMDLPTVNSDAKQMIYSVINSQEEMNQQVLYLLGIGRFYTQTKNNQTSEDASQQSQTSLAMQSLLSGTISQQINNVLSSFVNSSNWNFGANISTGNEGFNNAEYEGILSGRLLNNRLLFNGQFGYRDNANATQSFIGDFDLRYLIFPNGNLSIHVYNQTNDRYFTRNSLNTQGVGLIMKKDFFNLRDLLGIKKKSKDKEKEDKNKKKGKK
ncbi:MAG: translocation/assembly module TamB domain-containing protein [Prevotella sp.]|nr:translocation/assembly module TamB domain-containing protein [Prevotella sp.]